jgi:D-3-phosphoglycerate dehydrogenase
MTYKVLNAVHRPDVDLGEALLKGMDASLEKGMFFQEDELIEKASEADAVLCNGVFQPWTPRVIKALKKCRILASPAIGYNTIHVETASACSIVVTNTPDFCIHEVSNQAVALMMALNRKLIPLDRAVREKKIALTPFQKEEVAKYASPIFRLQDQTLGIIGFGRIGSAVGLKAKGLGMRVIAYDPYVFDSVISTHGAEPVDLDTLYRESDYISINALLNDETRGMVDGEAFKKMKPTCYLINTARGKIVDQAALVHSLKEGRIAGAGLDATSQEPIPEDDPLFDCPNVILTGHSGWYSVAADSGPEYWHKAMGQIVSALKGEWPIYAVNPEIKQGWLKKWGA